MIKPWINALRLRTLPLSLSGIFVGSALAANQNQFNIWICILACLTTTLYQVLSNYANDYGDGLRGTDNNRKGEARMVASGLITPKQMKIAILILIILSFLSSIILLWIAFLPENLYSFVIFLFLSIFAIWAAISYTNGKTSYGYKALGDIFVFLTFGLLAVLGSYYLYVQDIAWTIILPASGIGLLATSVLNLNNMRDFNEDKKHNKRTIPGILGLKKAKVYHTFLMVLPFVLILVFNIIEDNTVWTSYLFLILILPTFFLLKTVYKTNQPQLLDSELKKTAFLSLAFSLLFGFGLLI